MEDSSMQRFLDMYSRLTRDNVEIIGEVYREDIRFVDPAHEINGISHLTDYFITLYENVTTIEFQFEQPQVVSQKGYVQWEMTYCHRSFGGGRPVVVQGATYLEFDDDGKVVYHRDYFDLGAMVYEHVPLLGRIVKFIRMRLGK